MLRGGVHYLHTRVQAQVIHVHEIGCVHDVYANLYWRKRKNVHPNFQFFKPCWVLLSKTHKHRFLGRKDNL